MRSTGVLIAGLLAVAAGVGGCGRIELRRAPSGSTEQAASSSLIRVQVGVLRRMTVHRYVDGYGVVAPAPATLEEPAASAAVASPLTGVVTRVRVAAGQQVHRGELLVELNSDAMTEQYAAQEVARQRRLYAEHNTSLKALQDAEARLALMRVTAPLAGTVVRVNVKPGTAVTPSTVLAEVIDLERLIVQTDIPEGEARELKIGERVEVLGAVPDATRLTYISPTVNPGDGAVMAWARLPVGSGLLAGEYVRLRIVTATHRRSLVAPAASVVSDLSGHGDISIVRGELAIRTPVRSGLREDGWVEVRAPGLKSGMTVVTVGAYGLPRRTRIRIVESPGMPADDSPVTP